MSAAGRSDKRNPRDAIKVLPFRSWHIANYGGLKAYGKTRTEAIAYLLMSLRDKVEVVEIRIRPSAVEDRHG